MQIIATLLSYFGKFETQEDRDFYEYQILELLETYADKKACHIESFKTLSDLYFSFCGNWAGKNNEWFDTFDSSENENGIKEKFDEYIWLIQDEENRKIHEEERMERQLALDYGELDIGQIDYDEMY
jgi:hypothetical protein